VRLTTRPATMQDLGAVQALVELAYGTYLAEIGVEPGPLHDDYSGYISAGFVEIVPGSPDLRAIMVLIPHGTYLLIDNIAVHPDQQGKGLGTTLLARAEKVARSIGYERIRLYTHEKMTRNQALYLRMGFVETERVTERGLARVYFEKTLSDL